MVNRRIKPASTPITPGQYGHPPIDFLEDEASNERVAQDVIDKVNAGAALYYALYYHPKAQELFTSSPLMSKGFMKAYMQAQKVWGQ